MRLNKLSILCLVFLLSLNTAFAQSNTGFEVISSENFSRIVMLEEFVPHETELNSVKSIEFNAESNILAYQRLQELAFWNIYEQRLQWHIPVSPGLEVHFAADGSPLVAIAANYSLYIWPDVSNPLEWRTFHPNALRVSGNFDDFRIIGEGQNQEILAVTTPDFGIFRWQVSTGELIFEVHEPDYDETTGIHEALLREDGQVLAIFGRTHNYLEFVDTNTAESIGAIELLNALGEELYGDVNVNFLAFNESKQLLLNVFSFGHLEDSVLAVINPDTLALTQIEYDFEAYWVDAAISENSDIFALADGFEGGVYFFDKDTIDFVGISPIAETDLMEVAFSPDGKFLATGDFNGMVRLWGIPNEE